MDGFSWQVKSMGDVLGLIGIIAILGVVILVGISILSRNGIQIGAFRMGARKKSTVSCLDLQETHTKILRDTELSLKGISEVLNGIHVMQQAQTDALDLLLGHMAGEHINGNLEVVRSKLAEAKGFKKATMGITLMEEAK